MAKDNQGNDSELQHLRDELAVLRSVVREQLDSKAKDEAAEAEKARFLAWVNKTTEEKTQLVADAKFKGLPGDLWEVQLLDDEDKATEHPKVRVPAHSDYEAIGRYNDICGITSTNKKYSHAKVSVAA